MARGRSAPASRPGRRPMRIPKRNWTNGLRSMRIRLKGINWKRKRLADGRFKTYYWAWKGGPPLRGEPGTPEFVHSYNEAVASKVVPPTGKLLSVLQAYQVSGEFNGLAARTRFDYIGK